MSCAQNSSDCPARKRPKYASWTLTEKIWLLDHARNNPKLSYDEVGEALAAEYNSKVKDDRDKRNPVKKPTIAGWKKQGVRIHKWRRPCMCGSGRCRPVTSRSTKTC
jgi:hypothetical protein